MTRIFIARICLKGPLLNLRLSYYVSYANWMGAVTWRNYHWLTSKFRILFVWMFTNVTMDHCMLHKLAVFRAIYKETKHAYHLRNVEKNFDFTSRRWNNDESTLFQRCVPARIVFVKVWRFVMSQYKIFYCITKTCLYNFYPLEPNFYTCIVKLGFTGVYIIISAQKHRS